MKFLVWAFDLKNNKTNLASKQNRINRIENDDHFSLKNIQMHHSIARG